MAKLGKSLVGAISFQTSYQARSLLSGPYTANENGVIDNISWYINGLGVDVQLGLYLNDESDVATNGPGVLVAKTNYASVSETGWKTLSIQSPAGSRTNELLQGKRYWLAATWKATNGNWTINSTPTGNAVTGSFTTTGTPAVVGVPYRISITSTGWTAIAVSSVVESVHTIIFTSGSGTAPVNGNSVTTMLVWPGESSEEKWLLTAPNLATELRDTFQTTPTSTTLYREASAYLNYTPVSHNPEDNSLQGRINRANPGETILVHHRDLVYNEQIRINKPLKLIGRINRRTGKFPIIQGGVKLTGWTLSTAPEHTGRNVWYKDISIRPDGALATLPEHNGAWPTWVRTLQIENRGVQIIQHDPSLAGFDGVNAATVSAVRGHVLGCDWSSPGYKFSVSDTFSIDFWQWYDAIACAEQIDTTTTRLWLRLNSSNIDNPYTDPNNHTIYATFSRQDSYDWNRSNDTASGIVIENTDSVTIENLEIRGGRWAVDCRNSTNLLIRNNQLETPGVRTISLTDCQGVLITHNEITDRRLRTNEGPGFDSSTTTAQARRWGWQLSRNRSQQGIQPMTGHSIDLVGSTSDVTIRRNWIHHKAGGVTWGIYSARSVGAVIENNRFEYLEGIAIMPYPPATGIVQNNIFKEVAQGLRMHAMGGYFTSGQGIIIEGNYFRNEFTSGYLFQAHNTGVKYRMAFTAGSGPVPQAGDTVIMTGGSLDNATGVITDVSGDGVTGSIVWHYGTLHPNPFTPPTSMTIPSTGWSGSYGSVELIYEWTTPILFQNNFVQNVAQYTANVQGAVGVSISNNILDSSGGFSDFDHTLVENNWVGGNLGVIASRPWFSPSNVYIPNQRLVGTNDPGNLPEGVTFPELTQKSGLKKHKKQSITIEVL